MLECVQYVSALRPPKLSRHAADGVKRQAVEGKRGEGAGAAEGRRRVYTLTYKRSAWDHGGNLPRHSLHSQSLSGQINWSVEQELKRRRRLAGFDQSYGEAAKSDSDSDPESGEATEEDEREWKQVGDGTFAAATVSKRCVCF